MRPVARGYSRLWLITAIALSSLLVLAAPFVGLVTVWLRDVAGGNYATVLAAIVGGCALVAVATAVVSIRERRAQRYGWLAAALAIAIGYAVAARSGVPDVDAAERFHFIEYGLVAVLFSKAWRPSGDASAIVLPLLAGLLVGTCEEWLQWFVPGRVGEWRDVLLNLVAVGCGILFSLGLDPSPQVTRALNRTSRRHVSILAAATIVVFGAFIQAVHLGHDIVDADAGVFRSRYTAGELAQISADRAERWRGHPPVMVARFSREDQYFSEAIEHVRRRNERWSEGNLLAARHENLILEKYYAPVLDTPSYVSATGVRWPDAQRAQAETAPAGGPGFMIYDSDALPYPVFTWPLWLFWLVVAAAVAGVLRVLRVAD
jgi:hypothetical protein